MSNLLKEIGGHLAARLCRLSLTIHLRIALADNMTTYGQVANAVTATLPSAWSLTSLGPLTQLTGCKLQC
jgi:hypothetical protein